MVTRIFKRFTWREIIRRCDKTKRHRQRDRLLRLNCGHRESRMVPPGQRRKAILQGGPLWVIVAGPPRCRLSALSFNVRLLADLCNDGLRLAFLAEVCQEKKGPRQALLARIEQLIHEVGFNSNSPSQKM